MTAKLNDPFRQNFATFLRGLTCEEVQEVHRVVEEELARRIGGQAYDEAVERHLNGGAVNDKG